MDILSGRLQCEGMKRTMDKVDDVGAAAVKFAGGFAIYGLTPTDWAGLATTAYFFLQGAYLVWKWNRESKNVGKK